MQREEHIRMLIKQKSESVRPVRLNPIRRQKKHFFIEESESNWAVSYADMLMVLLSFFILFFSIDKDKRNGIIDQIRDVTSAPTSGNGSAPSSNLFGTGNGGTGSGSVTGTQIDSLDRIASSINVNNPSPLLFKTEIQKERLLLLLPDNIYLPGKLSLTPQGKEILTQLLKKIAPYANELILTFVGHTDEVKLVKRKGALLEDNLDLSAMRAARALSIAKSVGIKEEQLFVKGAGALLRKTRSLTLVLTPKGDNHL